MNSKKKILALLAVLFSVVLWGVSFVSTKTVMSEIPPVTSAWLRQFIAIIPLSIFMYLKNRKLIMKIKAGQIKELAVATFFGIVLYFVFENNGLNYTSASNGAIIIASIPLFVMIVESIKKRAVPSKITMLSLIVTFIGVYIVMFNVNDSGEVKNSIFGNILIFGAVVSWIIYTLLSDRIVSDYSSLETITYQTLFAIPLFIPFIIFEIKSWSLPSANTIFHLVFLGVFCSAFAYVAYFYSISVLGMTAASAYLNLTPFITVIADYIFWGEVPSKVQIIGSVLIIGGLTFMTYIKISIKEPCKT